MLARRKKKPDSLVSRPAADRYPSGQKRESVSPALIFRIKQHGVKLGMDPRLGTVLGIMGLRKELSDAEVAAGFKIAEIVGRYERMKGIPRRNTASPSYQRGFGSGNEIDEARMTTDQVKSHQRLVRRATKAYDALQNLYPNDRARDIIERVCCDDERISPDLIPSLAACLHHMAEKYDMVPKAKPKLEKAKVTTRDDITLMASACVDAMERRFEFEKSKATTFQIAPALPFAKERGLIASDGKRQLTVMIPRRGVNPVLLDAALRAQALNKGWLEADADTGEVE